MFHHVAVQQLTELKMTDKERGIGDNSAKETNTTDYKGLLHHLIDMVLEPRINVQMFLKSDIERARVATRVADRFAALQDAEETRKCIDSRLEILEYFRSAADGSLKKEAYLNDGKRYPPEYKWENLKSAWGTKIHDEYKLCLKLYEHDQGDYYSEKIRNGTY